jgi:hypothetical protein
MPIYLRFENGLQVETTTLPKKPEGAGWQKAPADFDWEKRYKLTEDGSIAERNEPDVTQELLDGFQPDYSQIEKLTLKYWFKKFKE